MPAPMPRFVDDVVAVVTGVGESKTEVVRTAFQPRKRRRFGKVLVEPQVAQCADIQGATRVVLAAAGCGDMLQDRGEGLAAREFLPDDFGLPGHAAKSGEWKQFHAILAGGVAHALPCLCRTRRET